MNLLDLIKQRRAVCDAAPSAPWFRNEDKRRGMEWNTFASNQDGDIVHPFHNGAEDDFDKAEYTDGIINCVIASRNERPSELDALAIAVEALASVRDRTPEPEDVAREALAQIRAKLENTDAKS